MMRTILIVDDEPAARYGMRRALEGKYKVAEADSAAAARALLAAEPSDLILLDLVMPGEDGLTFLRWIVSALDSAKTAVDALQSGAADYIVKGYDIEELRKRVANILQLAELGAENTRLRRELVADGQFGRMLGSSAPMRRVF
jgi:two-component system response regulator AtoC